MTIELTSDKEKEIIEKVARFIVDREMSPIAILFLEAFKPLSIVGSYFGQMFIEPFLPVYEKEGSEIILTFQKIENTESLIKKIEELEEEKKLRKEKELEKEEELGKEKKLGKWEELEKNVIEKIKNEINKIKDKLLNK